MALPDTLIQALGVFADRAFTYKNHSGRPPENMNRNTEFGYGRKYVSPPADLISCLNIRRESILAALAKSPVLVEVITGSKDERMGADRWKTGFTHFGPRDSRCFPFFDDQHEFDLQEAVVQALPRR